MTLTVLSALIGLAVTKIIDGGDGGSAALPEPPKVRIDTAASLFNPKGTDDPADEYVCLVNESNEAVSLTDWTLYDSEALVNELSQFSLGPGQSVRVHPGGRDSRADTAHDRYGSGGSSFWNNGGDTVTLRDADGNQVSSQSFPNREDGVVSGTCGPPRGHGAAADRGDRDCGDFPTREAAQAFFLAHGGPTKDPDGLDADGDGVACESSP